MINRSIEQKDDQLYIYLPITKLQRIRYGTVTKQWYTATIGFYSHNWKILPMYKVKRTWIKYITIHYPNFKI